MDWAPCPPHVFEPIDDHPLACRFTYSAGGAINHCMSVQSDERVHVVRKPQETTDRAQVRCFGRHHFRRNDGGCDCGHFAATTGGEPGTCAECGSTSATPMREGERGIPRCRMCAKPLDSHSAPADAANTATIRVPDIRRSPRFVCDGSDQSATTGDSREELIMALEELRVVRVSQNRQAAVDGIDARLAALRTHSAPADGALNTTSRTATIMTQGQWSEPSAPADGEGRESREELLERIANAAIDAMEECEGDADDALAVVIGAIHPFFDSLATENERLTNELRAITVEFAKAGYAGAELANRSEKLDPGYVLKDGEDYQRDVVPVRCEAAYKKHIDTIRAVAREHGYAIGVHGSLRRDIDLIAAPWTESPSDPKTLAVAIEQAVGGIIDRGHAVSGPKIGDGGEPEAKPHGRLAWSIHLGGGPYIDLSVMPRREGVETNRQTSAATSDDSATTRSVGLYSGDASINRARKKE